MLSALRFPALFARFQRFRDQTYMQMFGESCVELHGWVRLQVPLAFGITARLFFRMDKDDVRSGGSACEARN
jgi:hypothetical protein